MEGIAITGRVTLNVQILKPIILDEFFIQAQGSLLLFADFHFLLFQLENNLSVFPLSVAEGGEVLQCRSIRDVEVDDAAEVRTHGGKDNAAPCATDEIRFLFCDAPDVILLCFTVAVDVEDKKRGAVEIVLRPHDGFQEMLDRVQCLTVPTNETARIFGDDIDAPKIPFLCRENIRVRNVEEVEDLAECFLEERRIHRRESSRKSPRLRGLFPRKVQRKLPNGVLEGLASLEGRDLHGRDLDLLRGVSGINASARLALRNAEGAEARDRHGVATLQFLRHGGSQSLESGGSCALRHTRSISDDPDEILFGEGHMVKWKKIRTYERSVQKLWASASQKRVRWNDEIHASASFC